MSGGSLDYFYCQLQEHVGDFNDKELDDLVKDLADLFYKREWYLSSDIGEGEWNEARDNFKKKWFEDGARLERIEQYLDDIKKEVLQSFGVSRNYCYLCKHWKQHWTAGAISKYGDCEFNSSCMYHMCDTCEKWEGYEE